MSWEDFAGLKHYCVTAFSLRLVNLLKVSILKDKGQGEVLELNWTRLGPGGLSWSSPPELSLDAYYPG